MGAEETRIIKALSASPSHGGDMKQVIISAPGHAPHRRLQRFRTAQRWRVQGRWQPRPQSPPAVPLGSETASQWEFSPNPGPAGELHSGGWGVDPTPGPSGRKSHPPPSKLNHTESVRGQVGVRRHTILQVGQGQKPRGRLPGPALTTGSPQGSGQSLPFLRMK